jgi:mono/diheme cytochrome c family protein
MRRSLSMPVVGLAMLAVACGTALAQPKAKVDPGKREYAANCASCHGALGKGDGPTRPYLTRAPTDLSTLAKANGGVMPVSRIYESIDGSKVVAGHGSQEMPVWGTAYRIQAAERNVEVDYDPEVYVRGRILALIDYIYRLQVK